MNRSEIDYLTQSLANKYFIANVILKHIGNTRRVNRCRVQQQVQTIVHKVSLVDVVCTATMMFWIVLLGGTFLLSLLGLFLLVFHID